MTPRNLQKTAVPKSKSGDYAAVAENFYQGADLAKEFEYWNAAGVLIVHAAIAYADAITIRKAGIKSRGEDHAAAAYLLRQHIELDEAAKRAVGRFVKILDEKNRVSYSGDLYMRKDIERMSKELERLRGWAIGMLEVMRKPS